MKQPMFPRQSATEEAAMVRGLQERDPDAIATFVDRGHRAVYALACRLSTDPDCRRDWTHTVLIRLIDEMARGVFVYRRAGGFWAWFRKRAYYLTLNQLGEHRALQAREVSPGEEMQAHDIEFPCDGPSPTEELERAEVRRLIEEGLALVENPDQRRALQLLLDQELSYQEIAEEMGAELNTVRSWIRRGRIVVRRFLVDERAWGALDSEVA